MVFAIFNGSEPILGKRLLIDRHFNTASINNWFVVLNHMGKYIVKCLKDNIMSFPQ